MSGTRVFAPGALLPSLWLFEVGPLMVDGTLVDTACWICAPNDTVAMAQLRKRHKLRKIAYPAEARKMTLGQMSPAPKEDWPPCVW